MAHKVKVIERTPPLARLAADPSVTAFTNIPVQVIGGSAGPTTTLQKIQSAYKTVVVLLGGLSTFLTQIGPLAPLIPEPARPYFTGATIFVTALMTWLVQNQKFVESL